MKFKNILFPLDFSERSLGMASEVECLARRFGAKVTVLHVFEIPATWYGTAEAPTINVNCFQEFFNAAQESLENFKLDLPAEQVEKVICEGDPSWLIANWAREHPTDLIMIGTRGFGRLQGLLLGSVAAKVIHDTRCPVWTDANAQDKAKFQNEISDILCAVDIDEETVPLLRFADDVRRLFSAKLHVVHCIPEAETRPNKYLDFDLHRYLLEGARIELKKLQREAGLDGEITITGGTVSKAVRSLAIENKIGLIVLGRGESQHTFGRLRTHAYQIVHDAPCPVLSYCPAPPSYTSSSYSGEHLYQSVKPVPPPIGSSPI
jgi:nucleotide-binding universal stress UspA family protein